MSTKPAFVSRQDSAIPRRSWGGGSRIGRLSVGTAAAARWGTAAERCAAPAAREGSMSDAGVMERWKVRVGEEETSALLDRAAEPGDGSLVVLGHSSGGHMEFRTMANLAREFRARGFDVVRFNFLYREREQGPPDRMPRLVECFAAVVASAKERLQPARLFIGGHSMGGRAAS